MQVWCQLTRRGAAQGLGDATKVGYNSLDSITFAFDLRLQTFHLVAVKGVGNILLEISVRHGRGCCHLHDEC